MWNFFVGLGAGVLTGFLIGVFAFKVKNRWCPRCGSHTTVTLTGAGHAAHR
ncbi:hypothetical protein [Pilimelia terevasa]|uniref:hypothetical protein n=1 Tax=Pilimelia terevasa TaxID=53372 RepID=UPI00166B4FB4|nr:hypothetical protein [Pilimelia terevasa]